LDQDRTRSLATIATSPRWPVVVRSDEAIHAD
jgi:hypothetical protein